MNSSWSRLSLRRAAALLVLSVVAVFVTAAVAYGDSGAPRIVGGQEADPGEWPWQVALVLTGYSPAGGQFCGGSLIARDWVLTAAHCITEWPVPLTSSDLEVVAGIHDRSAPETGFQRVGVAEIIVHPGWDSDTNDNDITLLRLASPIDERPGGGGKLPIEFVDLVPKNVGDLVGVMATVTGWGDLTPGGSPPMRLYEVEVPIISNTDCSNAYSDLTANMLCAGFQQGGKDSCQGDSGGPLVYDAGGGNWRLAGVVSFGYSCALPNYPGVYARVSRYENWINSYVNPLMATDFAYLPVVMDVPLLPAPAQPTEPANGSTLNTLIPTFRWTAPPADTGELRSFCLGYSPDPDGVGCIYSLGGYREESRFQIWSNLEPATRYYWRVGIIKNNNYDDILWSEMWQFTTGSGGVILPAPVLLSPPDGSMLSLEEAIFQWTAVTGNVEYQLLTCLDGGGCYIWFTANEMMDFSSGESMPEAGNSYWYVAARNDYAWGVDSESWSYFLDSFAAGQADQPFVPASGWSMVMSNGATRVQQGK